MVKINSTTFGEIVINGKTYYSDMIVWWDGKKEFRDKSHIFDVDEFVKLLKKNPKAIVIGTGQKGTVKIPEEVMELSEMKGVEIFVETSQKAIEIFNGFVKIKKKVVAVIHTTL